MLAASADARACEVGLLAAPEADAVVLADADALALMLRNLIDNALRHTPAGGEVRVAARRLASGGVEVAVEDSGPGIAPSERQRVLDRFYRAPGAPGHGSGLGLAIVRTIAERHGSTLALDSSPDLGGLRVSWRARG